MRSKSPALLLAVLLPILFSGCSDDDPPAVNTHGRLVLILEHRGDGRPLVRNQRIYINAAGNPYEVSGLKYFLSDITLYPREGAATMISKWQDIFYIDEELPATKTLRFYDPVPAGSYDSIAFIFGIPGEKNQSYMYVNPPEVNMAWPQVLGGGYHYLMLDGKWLDTAGVAQPFNFHLGIGQLYHGTGCQTDSIYAFVQNWFRVSLPGSAFTLTAGDTAKLRVAMNIESWFDTPNIFDFNYRGGAIMQNQPAMEAARENGRDVFEVVIR